MLIALWTILAASVLTAAVITWLLLTGRATAQTRIGRAPRVRTPEEIAARNAALNNAAEGFATGMAAASLVIATTHAHHSHH